MNGSSVDLDWSEPLDAGGRSDLYYEVQCSECPSGVTCIPCTRLSFFPRPQKLTERRIRVSGLRPRVTYTFRVLALNGVSDRSGSAASGEELNVTTDRDRESHSTLRVVRFGRHLRQGLTLLLLSFSTPPCERDPADFRV